MIEPRPELEKLADYVPGKSIEEISAHYGLKKVVKLASNENPLGASPRALMAYQETASTLHMYPRGDAPELIAALAKKAGLSKDYVVIGNGSDEIIDLIAKAFIRPSDRCLGMEPTFSMYRFSTLSVGGFFEALQTGAEKPSLDKLLHLIDSKTRVVFICNPNNPTGWYFTDKEIRDFLAKVPKSILVFVDEAYAEFATAEDYPKLNQSLDVFPNLFINRTFSKIYGLAGLRVGYGFANPKVIKELWKIKPPFDVNRAAQAAALAALGDEDHFQRTLDGNVQGMAKLSAAMEKLGFLVLPSQANFICVKIGPEAKALVEFLEQGGVIVRGLTSFGMPEWIRITIGLPEENEFFLQRIAQWGGLRG
ncbi:MAG: histidinol-phosphate transaminase [Fibrobacteraceae bacterium]